MAALAVDAPAKWVDNLLSQHEIAGMSAGARGMSRRIGYDVLLRIALVRFAHVELGCSVASAVALATELFEGEGSVMRGALELRVDLAALRGRVDRRLGDALESAPSPRRGRPPAAR